MLNCVTPARASRRNLCNVRLGGTKQTEAINHFIGHEVRVAAAHFAMMKVIVMSLVAYIRGEGRGKFLRLVARNQIHDVVRNQCRKPAHMVAADFRSSETQTGAAAMISIFRGSLPAASAPFLTKPTHHSIRSGSANCKITPSPMRPASSSTLGPYPATQTGGTPPFAQVRRALPPS